MGRRGRACTICTHAKRHQIEIGMVHRVPMPVLARRFEVKLTALKWHRRNHLTPQAAAAILAAQKPTEIDLEALQASESEGLLAQLVCQRARLQLASETANDLGDVKASVACENAITANLTLVAKLLGQLVQHHEVKSTSLLISPDYLELRSTLVNALRPFPEAARAVSQELHALESRAAAEIKPVRSRPLMIDATPGAVQ